MNAFDVLRAIAKTMTDLKPSTNTDRDKFVEVTSDVNQDRTFELDIEDDPIPSTERLPDTFTVGISLTVRYKRHPANKRVRLLDSEIISSAMMNLSYNYADILPPVVIRQGTNTGNAHTDTISFVLTVKYYNNIL